MINMDKIWVNCYYLSPELEFFDRIRVKITKVNRSEKKANSKDLEICNLRNTIKLNHHSRDLY